MGILSWIIFGAIAGWLASLFIGGKRGLILNVVMGIIGAVAGGWIWSWFGGTGVTGFNLHSFIVAVVGACVVIGILQIFVGLAAKGKGASVAQDTPAASQSTPPSE